MIPILYQSTATSWGNNGLGHLRDCISCKVTEERNGIYELEMQYPLSGAHYSEIAEECLLKARANDTSDLQMFRIYRTSKPINGVVTIYARHISYDLNGIPVTGLQVSGSTAASAMGLLFARGLLTHSFQAWSDIDTLSSTHFTKPNSVRSILGGQQGSILQNWNGEYEFDNYIVRLWRSRGKSTDVVIEYGKNLTDANQDRNIENTYTHLLPYAVKNDGQAEVIYYLSENDAEKLIQLSASELGREKAFPLDLSDKFSEGTAITPQALQAAAESWILVNHPERPKVNITASFVNLAQAKNYEAIAPMQALQLCDTVTVRFVKLGIDATAKVIKTTYDVLAEKYISIEVGDAKSNFASTIVNQQQGINAIVNAVQEQTSGIGAMINTAVTTATNAITGQNGGHVVLDPPNNPYRILVLVDTDDIHTAQKVVQINGAGIGFSETGVNGEYVTAWTFGDRAFNADFITTGTFNALLIRAGAIISADGNSFFDLDASTYESKDGTSGIRIKGGMLKIFDSAGMVDVFGIRFDKSASYRYAVLETLDPTIYSIDIRKVTNQGTVKNVIEIYDNRINIYNNLVVQAPAGSNNSFYGDVHTRDDLYIYNRAILQFDTSAICAYGTGGAINPILSADYTRTYVRFPGSGYLCIRTSTGSSDVAYFTSGTFNVNGGIYSNGSFIGSQAKNKRGIKQMQSALPLLSSGDIHSYEYIEPQEDTTHDKALLKKRRYGFVIGEGYKAPQEVLSEDGEHVDLYSMCSILWKSVQELSAKCEKYEARIATLEEALR